MGYLWEGDGKIQGLTRIDYLLSGNLGETPVSYTHLDVYKRQAFTRDPATGAKKLMGEYLINAQGEDVVAGVRTPSPISHQMCIRDRCGPTTARMTRRCRRPRLPRLCRP